MLVSRYKDLISVDYELTYRYYELASRDDDLVSCHYKLKSRYNQLASRSNELSSLLRAGFSLFLEFLCYFISGSGCENNRKSVFEH